MFALSLIFSAGFVGFVHSLSPGHWLPVVLLVKARKWGPAQAVVAALVTASGHIFVSVGLGLIGLFVGKKFFGTNLHELEEHAGLILVAFGFLYAVYSRFNHRHCHGHEHHGPDPRTSGKAPYVFLFSLGLSPCFAALPVFAAAIGGGTAVLLGSMLAFSLGVAASLTGGSLFVARGLVKLDHPIFEHYGDVITGLGVALMGVILLLFPHHHV
jgi:ABC-type nickel/cobalt efflux system permease component RcnA